MPMRLAGQVNMSVLGVMQQHDLYWTLFLTITIAYLSEVGLEYAVCIFGGAGLCCFEGLQLSTSFVLGIEKVMA